MNTKILHIATRYGLPFLLVASLCAPIFASADYTESQIALNPNGPVDGAECGVDTAGHAGTPLTPPDRDLEDYPVDPSIAPSGFFAAPTHFCSQWREHRICGSGGCDTIATWGWTQYNNVYVAHSGNYTAPSDIRQNISFYIPSPGPGATISAQTNPIESGSQPDLIYSCTNSASGSIDQNVGPINADGSSHDVLAPAISAPTTYTLTCADPGGPSATASVTVDINGDTGPTAHLQATSPVDPSNPISALTYQCTNSTSGSIDQGVGNINAEGDPHTIPSTPVINNPTVFTLTCNGAGSSKAQDSASVWINNPPPPPDSCLDINLYGPESVDSGTPFDLSWSASNIKSVVLDDDAGSSEITLYPPAVNPYHDSGITQTTTFTAKCTGQDNLQHSWPFTVQVNAVQSSCSFTNFTALPQEIVRGSKTTLSWATTGAVNNSCVGTPAPDYTNGKNVGTKDLYPTAYTLYRISCLDPNGIACYSPSIPVIVDNPTCSIKADPTLVRKGDKSKITWSVLGTFDSCTESGPGLLQHQNTTNSSGVSVPVNTASTYSISCSNASPAYSCTDAKTVNVTPIVNEF